MLGSDPRNIGALVINSELVILQHCGAAKGELLPHLSIAALHDMMGVRVDPNQSGGIDDQPGLFHHFAYGGVFHGLPWLYTTARERPQVVVFPPNNNDAPFLVQDHRNGERDDARCLGAFGSWKWSIRCMSFLPQRRLTGR